MAELKTKKTAASVPAFLKTIEDTGKRKDCETILKMMEEATGAPAKMWGEAIIGFGDVHLKYDSGRELDWFRIGFSPRKANITLYISFDVEKQHEADLKKLGKFKTGKGCLYIKSLADVDQSVLKKMIQAGCRKG